MTYDEAKAQETILEAAVKAAAEQLKAFPRNSIGLVSDSIRTSLEYRDAKGKYVRAFAALRAFNARFVKMYSKEIRQDRDTRRANKLKALEAKILPEDQ